MAEEKDTLTPEKLADAQGAQRLLTDIQQFLPQDTLQKLEDVAAVAKVEPQGAGEAEGGENEPGDEGVEGGGEGEAKPDEKQEDKKPDEKVLERKSKLGLGKQKEQKNETVFEKPEDILGFVEKKYGQKFTDIKELPKFFEHADKWRESAQKFEKTEERLKGIESEIVALPADIHAAINLFQKGEDYTQALVKKNRLDLSKPLDKQDVTALVKNYYPDKFTDADFAETDKSETLKAYMELAQEKFKNEKQNFDNERVGVAERSRKSLEAQKIALTNSVNSLQERFPDMDTDSLNEVKSIMEGGSRKVLELFLNPDGTVKPDAAIRITMALHGESELLPEAMQVAAHIAETKLNEEKMTRGADGSKPVKTGGSKKENIEPEIKTKIDEVTRITKTQQRTF